MRILVLLLTFFPIAVFAQGDLESERTSLESIDSFAADVTIEGPRHLVSSDILRSDVVLHRIVHRLREAGLRTERASERSGSKRPHLHVHVNIIELDRGLLPFSVAAEFYQDVQLDRNRRGIAAVTWHESVLGAVSSDLLGEIPEAVDGLVDLFIKDYLAVNGD